MRQDDGHVFGKFYYADELALPFRRAAEQRHNTVISRNEVDARHRIHVPERGRARPGFIGIDHVCVHELISPLLSIALGLSARAATRSPRRSDQTRML